MTLEERQQRSVHARKFLALALAVAHFTLSPSPWHISRSRPPSPSCFPAFNLKDQKLPIPAFEKQSERQWLGALGRGSQPGSCAVLGLAYLPPPAVDSTRSEAGFHAILAVAAAHNPSFLRITAHRQEQLLVATITPSTRCCRIVSANSARRGEVCPACRQPAGTRVCARPSAGGWNPRSARAARTQSHSWGTSLRAAPTRTMSMSTTA